MLQLKAKLPKEVDDIPVTVAYLGFNSGLELLDEEIEHILISQSQGAGEREAAEVLVRRLAGATIVSLNNPEEVTKLPMCETVYHGYKFPSVDKSKDLLLEF